MPSTLTTRTVTGLTNGTAHVFRVAAVNAPGTGTFSTASAAVTPTAGDALFASVSLLLPMDGTNGSTTFSDFSPTPKTATVSGGVISTAQVKNGSGSGLFNISGGTNVVSFPHSDGYGFTSGDSFTIELWYYPTSYGTYNYLVSKGTGGSNREWGLGLTASALYWYRQTGGADIVFSPAASSPVNQWTHIAAVCNGTTVTLYKDGISLGSTAWATPQGSGQPLYVMQLFDFRSIAHEGRGYIDDLRITKGHARYTANFTPPVAAFPTRGIYEDPFMESVSLLLPMDGTGATFIDSSLTPKVITAFGDATQSTTQSKFGGKSAYFDGTGDYLTASGNSLGSSDFCIEGWFYFTSLAGGTFRTLWAHRSSDPVAGGAALVLNGSALNYWIAGSGTNWQVSGASTGLTVSADTWIHLALVRTGNECRVYLNGTGGNTVAVSGVISSSGAFSLMAGTSAGEQLVPGFCDDFRVTIGHARYTGATITVPTAAFPTS